ncbi:glutathione S-transferase [Ventosimonas gracilis]|uniref:Glutathione S-transferase n=1 Tax=Ventosimonas gracilis TaxID=1680762 RepID=A0A139SW56_9GAMM|nr:glutathione transferase GstA [Ventosimonas gracilis]KXU38823.1 glutathione S-transferase [Ventosimonas gracilis]
MKLYYSPGACSLAPHIVLLEAGLCGQTIKVSTKTHQLEDGSDYYSINPLGYVPFLLTDSGQTLRETAVIVQYLADLAPQKQLIPASGSMARYQLQSWLNFIATELHQGLGPLFRPTTPEDYKPLVRQRVLERLQWVDEQLAGKSWLSGEQFSVADVYLFVVSGWTQYVEVDISGLKNLVALRERIMARPAVQAAMKAEGLI